MGRRTRRLELGAAHAKIILSHAAVTVAIPATTRVDHVRENLSAAAGPMPDPAMRQRIAAHVKAL
jgi:aryl-alcohol dehydrogenase-like predicted oxidoreductase